MITRTNQALALALIAQIMIGIVLFLPGDSDTGQAAGVLLAEFEPDQVMKLTIHDRDDNTLVLHQTEQDVWVLPDKDNYPVTASRVQQLLDKLQGIDRTRLIARQPSSHNRLGVSGGEYERLIEIELADNESRRVYLGTSAGSSAAHVRLNDEEDVYLTNELAAWEVSTRLAAWVDTTYFSVPRDDIVMLQIENANGVFQLQKHEDTWTLVSLADDETFDPASVTSLLSKISTVRLAEPIGQETDPAWNMDDPAAKITVTVAETATTAAEDDETDAVLPSADELLPESSTPDVAATPPSTTTEPTEEPPTVEKIYELRLGQQLDEDGYPLISSESEYYVKVSTSTAEGLLNLAREDFLVDEPATDAATETPGPTATPQDDGTE